VANGPPSAMFCPPWLKPLVTPLTTRLSPPQRNLRRQCLGVRRCYDVQLGRYWETKDTRKGIKLALIIYRDFMQNFSSDFERRGNIAWKNMTTENNWNPNVFSLRSNVISFLCAKDFWLRWLKWLCLARKVQGLGHNWPKSKHAHK